MRLFNWLHRLKTKHSHRLILTHLCYSLRCLPCPGLLITNEPLHFCQSRLQKVSAFRSYSNNAEGEVKLSTKKVILITCRVHPGETNSSFVLEGLVEFLLSTDSKAVQLRSKYAFCIVPMLNPDGVVKGNSRCSSIGMDLNRKWLDPNKVLQPTIFYSKQLMRELSESGTLFSYIDLHGHSAKRNVFLFGCQALPPGLECKEKNRKIRLFPYLLAKLNKMFSVFSCIFNLDKQKESTGRGVAFKEFGVELSYTIETSFHGADMLSVQQPNRSSKASFERRVNKESFTENMLKKIGKDISLGFLILQKAIELNEKEPRITLQRKKMNEIMNSFMKKYSFAKAGSNDQARRYHRIQHQTLESREKTDKSVLISIPVVEPEIPGLNFLRDKSWKGGVFSSHPLHFSRSRLKKENSNIFQPDQSSQNLSIRKKSAESQRERPYFVAMVRKPQCELCQQISSQDMEFSLLNNYREHFSTEHNRSVHNQSERSKKPKKTWRDSLPISKLLKRYKKTTGAPLGKGYNILYAQGKGAVEDCTEKSIFGSKFRAANFKQTLPQQVEHIDYQKKSLRYSTTEREPKKETAYQAYTFHDKVKQSTSSFSTHRQQQNGYFHSLNILQNKQKEGESSSKNFAVGWTCVKSGINETENIADMRKKINAFFQPIRRVNPSQYQLNY